MTFPTNQKWQKINKKEWGKTCHWFKPIILWFRPQNNGFVPFLMAGRKSQRICGNALWWACATQSSTRVIIPAPRSSSASNKVFVSVHLSGFHKSLRANTHFVNPSGRAGRCSLLRLNLSMILTLCDRYRSLPACIDSAFIIYSLLATSRAKKQTWLSADTFGVGSITGSVSSSVAQSLKQHAVFIYKALALIFKSACLTVFAEH